MTYKYTNGYPKGDFLYPSVTKIIGDCTDKSRALTQWSANQVVAWIKLNCAKSRGNFPHYKVNDEQLNQARFNFREVSDEALKVGSAVHAAIEQHLLMYMKSKPKKLTDIEPPLEKELDGQAWKAYFAFLDWAEGADLKPISVEQVVYGNCWAGTLDLDAYINGKRYISDFKSSKAIYANDYGPQIAAYRSTYPPGEIEGSAIIRFDKESGEFEWKDFSDRYEKDLKVFNKMVELYMLRHKIIAKKAGWKEGA